MSEPSNSVAAILLTGGASRRMGQDKSQLIVDGVTLAIRTSSLLQRVVETAIEVGPGVSGLPSTREEPLGGGPLVAIAAGWHALREKGHTGSALVVACDLPLLSEELLRYLVECDAKGSVLPVVRGRPQPLCAKWGRRDLDDTRHLVNQGIRSLKHLSAQPDVVLLHASHWRLVADETAFSDVDSPADLQRLGLST